MVSHIMGLPLHCLLAPNPHSHLKSFDNWPTSLVGRERWHLRWTAYLGLVILNGCRCTIHTFLLWFQSPAAKRYAVMVVKCRPTTADLLIMHSHWNDLWTDALWHLCNTKNVTQLWSLWHLQGHDIRCLHLIILREGGWFKYQGPINFLQKMVNDLNDWDDCQVILCQFGLCWFSRCFWTI